MANPTGKGGLGERPHDINRKGRPKNKQSIPDILRRIGQEEGTADGKTKLETVMALVYKYASEGRSWAVQFIADRTEGKAVDRIQDISGLADPFDELTTDELRAILATASDDKSGEESGSSESA